MSIGGGSLHKKDYAMLAGIAGLGATGLGAAGIGPLAGLLGGGTTAAAALGPGAAAEVGSAAVDTPGFASLLTGAKGLKGLDVLMRAQQLASLTSPQQSLAQPQMRPQGPQMAGSDALEELRKRIYGGMA